MAKELKRKQEQARTMKQLTEERERRLKREEEERLAFLREQEREQVEVSRPTRAGWGRAGWHLVAGRTTPSFMLMSHPLLLPVAKAQVQDLRAAQEGERRGRAPAEGGDSGKDEVCRQR